MEKKKYTIQEKVLELSPVTPRRLREYCDLIGISSFKELGKPETLVKLNQESLEIAMDPEKVRRVLEVCTIGSLDGIQFEDVEIERLNEIFNDFFSSLFWRSEKPGV